MAWIEVHQALFTHRKTLELADLLDIPPVYAAAHLISLWTWSLDNAPNGALNVRCTIVARACGWSGDANALVNALIESGFLDNDETGNITIHDWDDYAGRLVEKRKANADRMRNARASNKVESAMHVHSTFDARAGATVHNSTVPNIESVAQAPTPRATRKTLSAHPIPPDFTVTADMRQWARDKHISEWIDIDRHTERFILYWTVGEGQGKTRKNWRLVWENWMTREAESAEARGARRLNGNGSGSNISQIGNGKPPEGYSWEKDEGGRWIHLTGDIRTGRLPYGATTDAEVTERHRERTRLEGQNRRAAS